MTIQELYDMRARAWEAAKDFLDTHGQDGKLSAEDAQTYERMEQEITDITAQINRRQRLDTIAAEMDAPTSTPITGRPGAQQDTHTGRASRQYAQDMLTAMRTSFRSVTDVLEEGNDANGGYLVPEEWDGRLIDTVAEENVMRRLGTAIRTSGEHKINIAATKPAALWVAEGGALTFGTATFDQKVLDAHKLHVAVKVTEELLYDSAFNLENYLIDQFGRAIGNAEEAAFLTGTGSGQPLGIFVKKTGTGGVFTNSEFSVPVSEKNSAPELKSDDILSLIYALKRPYRKKANFVMNDKTLAAVRKLKDVNQAYMWQPSYQAGEPDRLCGYAVETSAYAPEMPTTKPSAQDGDTGFIAFGDFSYYNIGDRGTRSIQLLRELFAGNGMIGYVMKERVDGLLVLPEAVQVMYAAAASS